MLERANQQPAHKLPCVLLENDKRHCHNLNFLVVFSILTFMLKAKTLIKQVK